MSRVTAEEQRARGFGESSSGVWCADAGAAMVARLARLGFDWLCLDSQHGVYSRTEIINVARSFPSGSAQQSSAFPPATSLRSVPRWMRGHGR
jgi:2-keto-3-deoxy-L-rhamnonate aldolase RhmA